MKDSLGIFAGDLKNAFKDLFPIIVVVALFQGLIIQAVPANLTSIIIGLIIVAIGLALFIRGLELGIFPIGEGLAVDFAKKGSTFWLLLFAFTIGFSTTVAEPALIAIADKSSDHISRSCGCLLATYDSGTLCWFCYCARNFAYLIRSSCSLLHHARYILVVIVTFFAPKEIIGLAYDSGGVTTSTVTVPLVAALGIGLASSIKGRNPAIDGFGLIAFASLTPMIFVQIYGIIVYNFMDAPVTAQAAVATVIEEGKAVASAYTFSAYDTFMALVGTIKDVMPILIVIFFFQYISSKNLWRICIKSSQVSLW